MKAHLIRRSTAAVAAAGLVLTLAACGGDEPEAAEPPTAGEQSEESEEPEPAPEEEVEETEATEPEQDETTAPEPTEQAPEDQESTEAPEAGAEETEAPAAEGGSFEVAAPGTAFAFGDTATLHVQASDEDSEFYARGFVESTVTEVREGDAAFLEQFENAEDFAGYTPYFIISEHTVLEAEGYDRPSAIEPEFAGLLADGSPAQGVTVISTGVEDCPNDYFEEFAVGATATTCNVALAEEGQEVTGAYWEGVREIDGSGSENPYRTDPVIWE